MKKLRVEFGQGNNEALRSQEQWYFEWACGFFDSLDPELVEQPPWKHGRGFSREAIECALSMMFYAMFFADQRQL